MLTIGDLGYWGTAEELKDARIPLPHYSYKRLLRSGGSMAMEVGAL